MLREGNSIARINPTPSGTTVKKTKYDITIVCSKPGFQDGTYLNASGYDGWVFMNIVLGGVIGWAIDGIAGADNKYDSKVNITMGPIFTDVPPPPPPPPSPPLR